MEAVFATCTDGQGSYSYLTLDPMTAEPKKELSEVDFHAFLLAARDLTPHIQK